MRLGRAALISTRVFVQLIGVVLTHVARLDPLPHKTCPLFMGFFGRAVFQDLMKILVVMNMTTTQTDDYAFDFVAPGMRQRMTLTYSFSNSKCSVRVRDVHS